MPYSSIWTGTILSLPTYYFVTFTPLIYAYSLVQRTKKPEALDTVNPRSTAAYDALRTALGERDFARYQRARAAHTNGLESFPLFATAVVVGIMTGQPVRRMQALAACNVILRAMYGVVYVRNETFRQSLVRSAVWMVMATSNVWVLTMAGLGWGAQWR